VDGGYNTPGATTTMAALSLRDVTKTYIMGSDKVHALRGV